MRSCDLSSWPSWLTIVFSQPPPTVPLPYRTKLWTWTNPAATPPALTACGITNHNNVSEQPHAALYCHCSAPHLPLSNGLPRAVRSIKVQSFRVTNSTLIASHGVIKLHGNQPFAGNILPFSIQWLNPHFVTKLFISCLHYKNNINIHSSNATNQKY